MLPKRARNMKPARPGERARKDEGDEDDALRRQADQRGGVGIGADGVEAAAEGEVAGGDWKDDDDDDGENTMRGSRDSPMVKRSASAGRPASGQAGCRWSPSWRREIDQDAAVDRQRPSVTMIDGTRPQATSTPLITPMTAPSATPRGRRATGRDMSWWAAIGADEIGGAADDRADRQVDVAGEHDQRLADGDDGDDRDARGDAVEGARGVVAVDQRAEDQDRTTMMQRRLNRICSGRTRRLSPFMRPAPSCGAARTSLPGPWPRS